MRDELLSILHALIRLRQASDGELRSALVDAEIDVERALELVTCRPDGEKKRVRKPARRCQS